MVQYRIEFDATRSSTGENKIPFRVDCAQGTRLAVGPSTAHGLPDPHVSLLLTLLRNELKSDAVDFDEAIHGGALHNLQVDPGGYAHADETWLKECSWQRQMGRDLYCTAVHRTSRDLEAAVGLRDGTYAYETDLETCRTCAVPDERILCAALSHLKISPKVTMGPGKYGQPERIFGASCRHGNDEVSSPENCRPGKNHCWHQLVSTEQWMPPPTDGLHVLDALDFLDSVWRSLHGGQRLLKPTSLSEAARLTDPVASLADFRDQVARLAELLQKIQINDKMLSATPPRGALERLQSWCDEKAPNGRHAVDRLVVINQLRNAMSHTDPPKVTSAFEKLGMTYPPESWPTAWQVIAGTADNALRDLRRELAAIAPEG